MSDTTARFHEGPEGRKEWEAWMASQPEEVQQEWEKYNEQYQDKFKSASHGKVAGYTHYWTHQGRAEGWVDISRDNVQSMLRNYRELLLEVPAMEAAYKELKDNPRQYVSPRPDTRFEISVGGWNVILERGAERSLSDQFGYWSEDLAHAGHKGLARTAAALAKAAPKLIKALMKDAATFSKHNYAYKPNYDAKVRSYERFIKNYKTLFFNMFNFMEKLNDLLSSQAPDILVGFTEEEWAKLVSEAKKIVANAAKAAPGTGTAGPYYDDQWGDGIGIFGPNGTGAPKFTKDYISLNGDASKELDHETFYLTRVAEGRGSNFCKTARKPYDAVVISILAAAQKIAPDALVVSSDGGGSAIRRVLGCEGGDPTFHGWLDTQDASVVASWNEFKSASDEGLSGLPADQEDDKVKSGLPGTEDEKAVKKAEVNQVQSRERLSWDKEAASGMYGYTKQIERDVQAAINRVKKKADHLARDIWSRDERTARFLQAHAERADSLTAKILVSSMKEIGPRVASVIEEPETTVKEAAQYGLYGFRQKTARLGLQACADLRDYFGQEAYSLHTRRAAKYDRITAFLADHSKRGRCKFSRLLLKCYPPKDVKVASSEEPWLSWDE